MFYFAFIGTLLTTALLCARLSFLHVEWNYRRIIANNNYSVTWPIVVKQISTGSGTLLVIQGLSPATLFYWIPEGLLHSYNLNEVFGRENGSVWMTLPPMAYYFLPGIIKWRYPKADVRREWMNGSAS